jgi:3-deoxy-D-manno-octulosonic-acid transferase
MLVSAFREVAKPHPGTVMLVAPRHPERFEEVARLLATSGVPFRKRSQWQGESLNGSILLVDSIGELAGLYALADIAFVGGSLVRGGGHNIIEPAQHSVPVLVGEHTENFRDIVKFFRDRDAVRVVTPQQLGATFLALLAADGERRKLGQRAAAVVESQRGATRRTLNELKTLMAQAVDEVQPA